MSKTPESKAAYAVRREKRLRRDKTAALIYAAMIGSQGWHLAKEVLVKAAVDCADLLLAELDRGEERTKE